MPYVAFFLPMDYKWSLVDFKNKLYIKENTFCFQHDKRTKISAVIFNMLILYSNTAYGECFLSF